MAKPRTVYLAFDVDGWLLYHEDSPSLRNPQDFSKSSFINRVLDIYPNENGRDIQLRRISVEDQDKGEDFTRVTDDNRNRRTHQGRAAMSRLVGGEITEVSNAAWKAEIEPRYPDMFKVPAEKP